jgi:hypothetical protein
MRLIRVIAKIVPSNRIASGKNSLIDGGWNSASADATFAVRVAA